MVALMPPKVSSINKQHACRVYQQLFLQIFPHDRARYRRLGMETLQSRLYSNFTLFNGSDCLAQYINVQQNFDEGEIK